MSETEFKIGQQVRIREGLESGGQLGGLFINPEMAKKGGQVVTIRMGNPDFYIVKEEGDLCTWPAAALEAIPPRTYTVTEPDGAAHTGVAEDALLALLRDIARRWPEDAPRIEEEVGR